MGKLQFCFSRSRVLRFTEFKTSRVNCVDVLYAASPIYLYLNPNILGYLLRPLLEYQGSGMYPNAYAAVDIGETEVNLPVSLTYLFQVQITPWQPEIIENMMKALNVSVINLPL